MNTIYTEHTRIFVRVVLPRCAPESSSSKKSHSVETWLSGAQWRSTARRYTYNDFETLLLMICTANKYRTLKVANECLNAVVVVLQLCSSVAYVEHACRRPHAFIYLLTLLMIESAKKESNTKIPGYVFIPLNAVK